MGARPPSALFIIEYSEMLSNICVSLEVRLISKYNPPYLNWVIRLKLHTLLLSTIISTCGILMQQPPPPPLLSHFQRLSSWISKSRVQKHKGWGFASCWSFCLLSVIGSTQLWENNKQVSYPFITLEIWNPQSPLEF